MYLLVSKIYIFRSFSTKETAFTSQRPIALYLLCKHLMSEMLITQHGQNAESVTVKMAVSVVTTVLQRIKCGKKIKLQ